MEIIYPLFAMFALTAFVAFRMGFLRYSAVKNRKIDPRFFKLYQNHEEPDYLRVISRHQINLFEAPVLFYAVCILIVVTNQTSLLLLSLAWLYVALRYIHSFIHLSSNNVLYRFKIFAVSWLVLIGIWAVLAIRLIGYG